jgi:hypothetical protein
MGEALINNLGGILTGIALVLTALTSFISVWRNGNRAVNIQAEQERIRTEVMAEQQKQNKHLEVIEGKVDGGMTTLQTAIANIATVATTANTMAASQAVTPAVPVERPTRDTALPGRRDSDKSKS